MAQSRPSEDLLNQRSRIRHKKNRQKSWNIEDGRGEAVPFLSEDPLPSVEEKKSSWSTWIGNGLVRAGKSTGNGLLYVVKHPVILLTSFITAAPPALNALANPSGQGPEEISIEWWNKMSDWVRAHSILNGSASLSINAIMNAFFLPAAWGKFKTNIAHTFDSPRDFIDNTFSIVFGIGGAMAASAIAYNAFLWLGYISASSAAFISFSVILASRYVGVRNVLKRIYNLFNEDAAAQADFADAINHIDEAYLEEIQKKFDEIIVELFADRDHDAPLTEKDFEVIADQFVTVLQELAAAHPDLIKNKTTLEYLSKYAGVIFDFSVAITLICIPSYLTFMQKGFDGVNTLAQFGKTDLDVLDPWFKRLIGLIPGLASSMLYADSATRLRTTIVELAQHLYENPKHIPFAFLTLAANGFAASGPQNVAAGVLNNKANIIGIHPKDILGTTFIVTNALGGSIVNVNTSLNKAFMSTNKDAKHVTERDLAKHLSKVNDYLVSPATANKFKLFVWGRDSQKPAEMQKNIQEENTCQTPSSVLQEIH
ncbi:MAG: hypothetical protein KIT56_10140 [Gammaproteobacteria bacterium]|nr:hypothetical protein [Gammaproteobacteria bacterium]MCW5584209.1 hypothetical protein [Gammaproteobacteria bacterium]